MKEEKVDRPGWLDLSVSDEVYDIIRLLLYCDQSELYKINESEAEHIIDTIYKQTGLKHER